LYAFARPPAIADFSGMWRVAELGPGPDGGFATGRPLDAVDPVGFLYTDYRVDVAACTGADAPPLTTEADEPETLVITHPATGEDVAVLPPDQASALALGHLSDEPPDLATDTLLAYGDEATNAAIQAATDGL